MHFFLAQTLQIYIHDQILIIHTLHVIMLKTRESPFLKKGHPSPLFICDENDCKLAEIAKFFQHIYFYTISKSS